MATNTGTFARSTFKSNSKFTSSAADTEAVADDGNGMGGTGGGDDNKEVLELLARLTDDERHVNHYDVPRATTTMFEEGSANEMGMSDYYNVTRATTTMFGEGSADVMGTSDYYEVPRATTTMYGQGSAN